LNGVTKLAHVSGPRIRREERHRFGRYAPGPLQRRRALIRLARRVALQEMLRQQRDVGCALA